MIAVEAFMDNADKGGLEGSAGAKSKARLLDFLEFDQIRPSRLPDLCARKDNDPLSSFHQPFSLEPAFGFVNALVSLGDLLHGMGLHPPIKGHLPAYRLKRREGDDRRHWPLL